MNKISLLALGLSAFLSAAPCFAATPKSYQVTGPVVELSDSKIVVQKGKNKWEILRTPEAKIPAGVKVGDKVTVSYVMSASTIVTSSADASVKPGKKQKGEASAKKKEAK